MASHIHPDPKQKGAAKPASPPAKPVAAKPAAPAKPATAPKPAAAPQAAAGKPAARPEAAHQEQAERRGGGAFNQVIACGISMLVHIVALLSMALIVTATPEKEKPREIVSSAAEPAEEFEDLAEQEPEQPQSDAPQSNDMVVPTTDVSVVPDVQVVSTADAIEAAPLAVELTDFGSETAPATDLASSLGAIGGKGTGGGFGARGNPGQAAAKGGGGGDTEQAVDAALKWIANHQRPDGSWHFDLKQCPSCQGQCSHGGTYPDPSGATAMALLPFLGRGYTHREGPYKAQIEQGIAYLAQRALANQGKVYGPGSHSMYVQGLAGIALSECYAMTQDQRLQAPTQLALNHIMDAQDPRGGGWRYQPKDAGDTSAVGWQIMALKSGNMAYLQINPLTIKKASEFLDSVQTGDGAFYGYAGPGNLPACTAVGLLCRMYLGWKKDHPGLQKGVEHLAKLGPSSDLYFNYYATQIMHHFEGDMWIAWNNKMKGMLLKAQARQGHETGSFYEGLSEGHGGHIGGRLYCTALSAMILEVYYRHLPIYKTESVDEEFKE
ncbi:MAG: prenyltransferase/squalene oxidase repeat-containing protein [Planctomycetaceae bacterium]